MNNNILTGIILIAIGLIIAAIFGGIGNYYIQKGRTDKTKEGTNEVTDSITTSEERVTSKIESTAQDIIEKNELEAEDLKRKVEAIPSTSKHNVVIENSPNSVLQINKEGDNIVNIKQSEYDGLSNLQTLVKILNTINPKILQRVDEERIRQNVNGKNPIHAYVSTRNAYILHDYKEVLEKEKILKYRGKGAGKTYMDHTEAKDSNTIIDLDYGEKMGHLFYFLENFKLEK